MEIRTGIRIDGEAAGAVNAAQQTESALDELAQSGKAAGRDVDAGMAQVTSASRAAGTATDILRGKQEALGKQAKLVAFQNQQLAFQLNDFFVQVSSGQSPLIAAIQQGSQLSGTYGGMGNAIRAVTSLITPARLAVGGLAGGVGVLALAAYQGAEQQNALARSFVLTGNAAGQTLGSVDAMAARVASNVGTSIGGARETISALIATGRVGNVALGSMATAIEKVTAFSGRAREDVIKDFTQMAADGPVKYAERANAAYNFLNLEQYRHIKQLQEQGRETEATALVGDLLSNRLGNLKDNLGLLESGWLGIKNVASGAWDAMLGIGRDTTPEERVQRALGAMGAASPFLQARKEEELRSASKALLRNMENASAEGERTIDNKKKIEAEQQYGRMLDQNKTKAQQLADEIKKIDKIGSTLKLDAKAIEDLKAGARERFRGRDNGAELKQLADARYANERAALEGVASLEKRVIDDRIRTNEQLYKLGLLDVRSYYATKTDLELQNIAAQEKLIGKELELARKREAEAKRPVDKLTANTEVLRQQERLAELQARKEDVRIANSNAKALKLKGEIDDLEKRLDAADADAKRAVFQQEIAGRERIEQLKIDQIKDPEERERAQLERRRQKMMDVVNASSGLNDDERLSAIKRINEEIGLENDALAERMKPGWKKMLDEWGNSAKLMRDTYNQSIEGMLRSGEDEFVRSKGNIGSTFKAMLRELESDLLRFMYRNSIGQLLGGAGGAAGGSSAGGGLGGLLRGVFGGTPFNPFGGGFKDAGGLGAAASGFLASILHSGNIAGARNVPTRLVSSAVFDGAPRFHQGVGPGERAAIIREDEGVFTPEQMKAMAPVGRSNGDVTVNLINQTGQNMQATARRNDDGTVEVMLRQVKDAVASDIANGEGSVFSAMQSRFGLRTAVA